MSKTSKPDKKPIEQYDPKGKERINLSPQRAQRTQSTAMTFALWYGIAPQRIRTRIGRIFTDIFNPCGEIYISARMVQK